MRLRHFLSKRCACYFLLFFFLSSTLYAERELKVLVLVIASDDKPVYSELQKVWRAYMHLDPQHVEAYFIRSNPDMKAPYDIQGDVIWCKGKESVIPGVVQKTVLSIECLEERLHEFDYVLRTNLSSFYVFPELLTFLKSAPRLGYYSALPIIYDFGINFGSGAGFIMSPDVAKLLIKNKKDLFRSRDYDDLAIGKVFYRHGIELLPAPRVDLLSLKEWEAKKDLIPRDQFHFRVKNNNGDQRHIDDIIIHKGLLLKYYSIELH